jgi:hypothetical protein
MTNTSPQTGIAVTTKFFVLAFLLYFFKPKVHIDNGPALDNGWGTMFVPLGPGTHTVRCYVPYMFFPTMGDSSVIVQVAPGQVVPVTWQAPWLVFLKGPMKVGGVTAAPAAAAAPALGGAPPPGWHPDPQGRHELRYWDGTAWTNNVSDAGATGTDDL